MTNHTKPTLLISNVLPARPGDEAYNNICMRLWDRLLQAALPTWNVIREYAQEDGAEGAALRAQGADAIVIMGGEDVHPAHYGASQGYNHEGRHWYRADLGQLALVDYAARTGTPLLGICRGMQIINTAFGGTLEQDIADGAHTPIARSSPITDSCATACASRPVPISSEPWPPSSSTPRSPFPRPTTSAWIVSATPCA